MKFKLLTSVIASALIMISCDTETESLGMSLTDTFDNLAVTADTFYVTTSSFKAGRVLSRSNISYLGTIRDPETGEYIQSNYTTQFHILDNYEFPEAEKISSINDLGEIIADSCELRLFFDSYYGDSLAVMKVKAHELDHMTSEGIQYYSDFNPIAEGYVRTNGIKATRTYTLDDQNIPYSTRHDSEYAKNIQVELNAPYTDKDGKTYNNYGSYVMQTFYKHPEYFRNSINFAHYVVPGFYLESVSGIGAMANIKLTQLNIYFRYKGTVDGKEKELTGTASFAGTEEVQQTTNVINDQNTLLRLLEDKSCTYLKTPTGIFTEMSLPVEEIIHASKHENDSINSAKVTLKCLKKNSSDKSVFKTPSTLLMIPKDSIDTFFEHNDLVNNKTSYLAAYDSSIQGYTFNNIGALIKAMDTAHHAGKGSLDWNKVVVIPVATTYSTIGSSKVLTRLTHEMSLTSTRLIGGEDNQNGPIEISVIYSKYE